MRVEQLEERTAELEIQLDGFERDLVKNDIECDENSTKVADNG